MQLFSLYERVTFNKHLMQQWKIVYGLWKHVIDALEDVIDKQKRIFYFIKNRKKLELKWAKISACGWCWKFKETLKQAEKEIALNPRPLFVILKMNKKSFNHMCRQTIIFMKRSKWNDNRWLRILQIWRLMGIKDWIRLIIVGYGNDAEKSKRSFMLCQPFNHKIVPLCLENILCFFFVIDGKMSNGWGSIFNLTNVLASGDSRSYDEE